MQLMGERKHNNNIQKITEKTERYPTKSADITNTEKLEQKNRKTDICRQHDFTLFNRLNSGFVQYPIWLRKMIKV